MIPFIRNNYTPDRKGWKSEYTLSHENFTGGLNNVKPENLIEDNECVDCKNMRIFGKAVLEKRPGIQHYEGFQTSLIGKVTWMDVYRPPNADPIFVRGTDTQLYFGNRMICNVAGRVRGVTFFGKYFFVDGQCLRVYNPEKDDVYKVVEEPIAHTKRGYGSGTSTTTISTVELDVVPDTVEVDTPVYILGVSFGSTTNYVGRVTAIDSTLKTVTITPSIELPTETFMIENSPLFFFNPLGDKYPQGEEYWIDELHEVVYLPCINELSDNVAGESYIPNAPNLIAVHQNRLVICGDTDQPHGIFISRTGQPLYFPANVSMAITPNGEEINNIFEFDGALVIGRKSDIHALYGYSEYSDSDGVFRISKMDTTAGFMNDRCGAILNNYYIYIGSDGRFYLLTTPTTNVEYLMTKNIGYKVDIYKPPFNFVRKSNLINDESDVVVNCVAHRNEVYFSIEQGDTISSSKRFVIVYNYDCMAFTYYTGWNSSMLMEFEDRLLIGRHDGFVDIYLDDTEVFNDNGSPIECNFVTKRFEPYGNVTYKFFKQLLITSFAYDNCESNIEAEVIIDYINHKIAATDQKDVSYWDDARWDENLFDMFNNIAIRSKYSRFDDALYNYNIWDSISLYKSIWYLINIRGRTIQYHFWNDKLNEGMRIYDMNTIYTARDVR